MSLPEARNSCRSRRAVAGLALVASLVLASACTVRPLYSNAPASPGVEASMATQLASIDIKPVKTRPAQEVRNHLTFLFNGGAARAAAAPYSMELAVTTRNEALLYAQVTTKDDEPTAGTTTMTATYTITDVKTGEKIATGKRSVSSAYDRPRQEFARWRAELDAENRAARELAEMLQLAIAQDLSKR